MTTLPQTTSIRLPRVGGPGGQLPGAPQFPPTGAQPVAAVGMTGADVWRVLRKNAWIIVAFLIVSLIAGVLLNMYLRQTRPRYSTQALVQVVNERVFDPTRRLEGSSGEFGVELPVQQKTQASLLMSNTLWDQVIGENDAVRNTTWFRGFEEKARLARANADSSSIWSKVVGSDSSTPTELAKESLSDDLRAAPREGQQLIEVTMSTADKVDGKVIVEALVNAHIEGQRQIGMSRAQSDYNNAKLALTRYDQQILKYQNQLSNISGRLAGAGNSGLDSYGRVSALEIELNGLVQARLKAEIDANTAESRLKAMEGQIQQGIDPPSVDRDLASDPDIQRIKADMLQTELSLEQLKEKGTDSPTMRDLGVRLRVLSTKLDERTTQIKSNARAAMLDTMRSETASMRSEVEKLAAGIEQVKSNIGELNANLQQARALENDIATTKVLQRDMAERLDAIETSMRQPPAGIKWAAMPTVPDRLAFPKLSNILPLTMLVGLALGLGIAFTREMMDTSVKSPRDIARVGNLNLLGMIPAEQDDPQLNGVPLHTAISAAPLSAIAEQFRQVRTRLQHSASLDTTRTIVVTSPGPQDGKTTVACNLAAGLALNGRRILLVDANFRRAELHKLYKVSNEVGFSNVLDSVNNLEAAVKPTTVANLDVLPTGPKPANPTELIESPLFSDFIDRALEEYDHVIFDAGPLLVVSEAVAMAPRVDGVVCVVRARANSRGILGRLRDTLKQTKAENLGVVLNGVRSLKGGYYRRNIKTYYAYQNND